MNVYVDGEMRTLTGAGNGPIAAFVDAIDELADHEVAKGSVLFENRNDIRVLDYHEHALSSGGDAIAAAYVECAVGDQILWGVGLDAEHRDRLAEGRDSARSTGPDPPRPATTAVVRPLCGQVTDTEGMQQS